MKETFHQDVARGISRGLAPEYRAPAETSPRLNDLAVRFRAADEIPATAASATPRSTRYELDKYLAKLGTYLPRWLCEAVKWLREPHRFAARAIVSVLLVAGGIFSFLPVLGLWMLPLGLIIISQDLVFLQRPLLKSIKWLEQQWTRWPSRTGRD